MKSCRERNEVVMDPAEKWVEIQAEASVNKDKKQHNSAGSCNEFHVVGIYHPFGSKD